MSDEFDSNAWELKTYKPDSTGFIKITQKVIQELTIQENLDVLNIIFQNGVALAQIAENENDEMLIRVELNNSVGTISMILTKDKSDVDLCNEGEKQ